MPVRALSCLRTPLILRFCCRSIVVPYLYIVLVPCEVVRVSSMLPHCSPTHQDRSSTWPNRRSPTKLAAAARPWQLTTSSNIWKICNTNSAASFRISRWGTPQTSRSSLCNSSGAYAQKDGIRISYIHCFDNVLIKLAGNADCCASAP